MDNDVSTGEVVLPILNSGLFWLIIAGCFCITVIAIVYFRGAAKHGDAIKELTAGEHRRTLVIVCVVLAITLLSLVKVIPSDDVVTIFAAIVGFVFGGATFGKKAA